MRRQNSIVATYLFAWNPKIWDWPDLPGDRGRLAKQGFIDIRWASGRVRQIELGSRAFMLRLGVPPKGLFGDGYTLTAPTAGVHWRDDKRAQGIPGLFVRIRLNSLYPLPVVTFDELAEPPFSRFRWAVRQSGMRVPSHIADALEVLWERKVAMALKVEADKKHLVTIPKVEAKAKPAPKSNTKPDTHSAAQAKPKPKPVARSAAATSANPPSPGTARRRIRTGRAD
jgi:hypothetical protein